MFELDSLVEIGESEAAADGLKADLRFRSLPFTKQPGGVRLTNVMFGAQFILCQQNAFREGRQPTIVTEFLSAIVILRDPERTSTMTVASVSVSFRLSRSRRRLQKTTTSGQVRMLCDSQSTFRSPAATVEGRPRNWLSSRAAASRVMSAWRRLRRWVLH